MKKSLLTAVVLGLAAPALAQSPQDHQQHHPGGSGPQAQSAPAQAMPPSTSPGQPQVPLPMPAGQTTPGMQGMMPSQGQSGSGSMMGGQSGMMMSCPMMQGGMRGMMGGQGAVAGAGAGGMIPMMAGGAHMMKVMFAVADANGDGALSFDEVTAIHKRIFDRVDANKDGKVTVEEIQSFMRE